MDSKYFQEIHIGNSSNISDGTLLTEDGYSFSIHKYALAIKNKYFHALFNGMGKGKTEYFIPAIKGNVLREILSYIYFEQIEITDENIYELTEATDYLLLENLFSKLTEYLVAKLNVGNCIALHMFLLKFNCKNSTLRESYRFIEIHFEELCSTNENFAELPLEVLESLLNETNLRIQNENAVWNAIVKWVEADRPKRLCRVPRLLTYLRITDVDEDLATEIMTDVILAKNKFCKSTYFRKTCSNRLLLKLHQRYIWNDLPHFPFCISRLPLKFTIFWDIDYKYESSIYVTYDENMDLCRKITDVNLEPEYIVAVDDFIYLFGTIRVKYLYNIREKYVMRRYNVIKKRWKNIGTSGQLPPFNDRRIIVLHLNGLIYILCEDTDFVMGEVKVYSPRKCAWYNTTAMQDVSYASALTLNGFIYVVGLSIYDERMILQRYNASAEVWDELPGPSFDIHCCDIVPYNEKIYLFGILEDGSPLSKSVEVFDPLSNVWYSIQSLPSFCGYYPRVVVINNRLIVTAGYNRHIPDTDVEWNDDLHCWERVDELSPLCKLSSFIFSVQEGEHVAAILKENKHPSILFEKSPFT